ncbi:ubiquitin-like 1-activating enzyme E1 B, partial [Phenoliferia sp. Uapishka_3]
MTGFGGGQTGRIEVLDLDTIDLSNLNRQFLFQKQHVKRPKAVVARETALKFNPHINITALHRNIKDAEFSVDYFKSFDFVLNALDNLDARRHVNKMCMAADIPLIESGTSGYVGQVQPIKKDVTECFDCTGKPVPKTFAVCTIRSTPSTAHHCIAWAKSYLFPQLFGADEDADAQDLDDAEKNGENADEIKELRKEAAAIQQLRATLTSEGAAQRVFEKVYTQDIERLLKMEDMWKHRKPPHPLSYSDLQLATEAQVAETSAAGAGAGIKDQRSLSLADSFALFISSIDRLSKRIDPANPLSFDKDDDDTLDFVVAAANLRASAFDIESQTRFQVKEYAGNIIPAIATTNAVIAGVLLHQSLHILRQSWSSARTVWFARDPKKAFSPGRLSLPNSQCSVCRVVYLPIMVASGFTLGEFVEKVVVGEMGWEGHVSVLESARLMWETEDFEDNKEKTLAELGLTLGSFINVLDDDDPHYPVSFSITGAHRNSILPIDSTESYKLGATIPSPIPTKLPPPVPEPDSDEEVLPVQKKRSAEEAGLEGEGSAKKIKVQDDGVLVLDDDDDDTIVL